MIFWEDKKNQSNVGHLGPDMKTHRYMYIHPKGSSQRHIPYKCHCIWNFDKYIVPNTNINHQ